MFFLLTTAAGSALWVARLEEQKMSDEEAIAAEEAVRDHPPAYTEYTDNPV
jgi:hypothetical protein